MKPKESSSNTHHEDPLDLGYINSLRVNVLDPIIDHWFRASLHGADDLPKTGPLILASNHSGNAFPHDALVLDALLWRQDGNAPERKFRSVYSPKLARTWLMRLFGIDNFWRRCGAVDMTYYNFRELIKHDERIVYYPEGIPGIGKGFNRRYQLQPFSRSFVVLAAEHGVPVYPVYTINAEWVNPTSFTLPWFDKIVDKYTGLPFFPIPAAFLAILFPFFFYFGFPCKMKFFVGKPLPIESWLEGFGWKRGTKPTRHQADKAAERARVEMQWNIDELVAVHGQKPYDLPDLIRSIRTIPGKAWPVIGLGWPYSFVRHERDLVRDPAKSKLQGWLRDIDLIAYYLPLVGWPIIATLRWARKPPYGYRGLSKPEKRKRQGGYLWSLVQIPLLPRALRFKK
jgi:1-acyl-sn-glycerol-3-phosphate acyltransferase